MEDPRRPPPQIDDPPSPKQIADALNPIDGLSESNDGSPRSKQPFPLARSLDWPVYDCLGMPQLILAPSSDRQIKHLLTCTADAEANRRGHSGLVVVHAIWRGTFSTLDGPLAGLPIVAPAKVEAYTGPPRSDCHGSRTRDTDELLPLLANNGTGDRLRAMNLALLKSRALYNKLDDLTPRDRDRGPPYDLVSIHALEATTSPGHPYMDIIYTFANRETGATRSWFERADVRGAFPYLTMDLLVPFREGPGPEVFAAGPSE